MGRGPEAGSIERLRIVGLGRLASDFPEDVASRVSRRVTAPCHWAALEQEPELPRIPGRDQLDADRLLEVLEAGAPGAGVVVVGLTAFDIAIPIFSFVFGRARCPGAAALVSIARLDPAFYGLPADPERTVRRTVDEILHELGHTAGLRHCGDPECLMRFAGSVEAVDIRGSAFCLRCAARLPRALRPGSVSR